MYPAAAVESAGTSVVDSHERADYWTQLISSYHCRMGYEFPDRAGFEGHTRLRRTESYQLVGWNSGAVTYIRGARHIRADPDDDYRLIVPLAGRLTFRSAEGQGVVAPGATSLVAIDRPFTLSMPDDTRGLIITIPQREIRHRLNRVALPAHPLDLTTGLGRVAGAMVGSLYAEGDSLTDRQFDTVAERLVDLLCMQILGEPGGPATQLAHVETTARRYIHDHAGDPHLTVARIAAALGWSVRQIQLAFHTAGTTPSEAIREERLRLARDRLRSPAYRQRSIADIASDLGFGSASSFTKAFRRRYGITPGRLREEPAEAHQGPGKRNNVGSPAAAHQGPGKRNDAGSPAAAHQGPGT
ncbi:AraC-like DNA-binding protein [Nocardia transvalensis]|uniref:AraC-like DNA-binding protein n=1 Tax=Nocardia transvalensis TaxID=37333 RepID=A0A7W9UHY2_9NOCA|nr:helix-turn-helix domain-containing protein [Nocardia transvalensis]MBB5913155.1 AraC-like DNA-binding protein [Nocardia transvalensis]